MKTVVNYPKKRSYYKLGLFVSALTLISDLYSEVYLVEPLFLSLFFCYLQSYVWYIWLFYGFQGGFLLLVFFLMQFEGFNRKWSSRSLPSWRRCSKKRSFIGWAFISNPAVRPALSWWRRGGLINSRLDGMTGLMRAAPGWGCRSVSLKLIAIMCPEQYPAERQDERRWSYRSEPLLPDLNPVR